MTALITTAARAYVNFGRWVADCPMACGGALQLENGQGMYACPECKQLSMIEWPPNVAEIVEALRKRPAPKNRNWFPSNHELALRSRTAHGQTVAELDEETEEYSK